MMMWMEKKRYLEFGVFMFVNFDPLYANSNEEKKEGGEESENNPNPLNFVDRFGRCELDLFWLRKSTTKEN